MGDNENGSESWHTWRKYVQEAIADAKKLRDDVIQIRIDLAVLKTKVALYAAGSALVVTILVNLFFVWLKDKT